MLQIPFDLMATAYRRKRLMEGLLSHDADVAQQISQINEKQALAEMQEETARKEAGRVGFAGNTGVEQYKGCDSSDAHFRDFECIFDVYVALGHYPACAADRCHQER